jgi:selenide,water dikinase
VLSKLKPVTDPRLIVSTDTVDDAGVYRLTDDTALVFTADYFTPIVDDAADFGRISVANALSDVYAMGGTPLIALNLIGFPDGELPLDVMTDILAGGQEKAEEAGVLIVGGHSVSDREIKYGLAVVGTVHPDRVVRNSGARAGDAIVLTKPIGTGVLATALKHEKLPDEGLETITALMTTLNRAAAEAMVAAGASGATDLTGFGLVGHLIEMARGSGVTIEIPVAGVPLIDGALDTLRGGLAPGGLFTNHHYYRQFVSLRTRADGYSIELLSDPQTSGGLLIALPPDRLGAFETAYGAAGGAGHWVIGRVIEAGEKPLVLT